MIILIDNYDSFTYNLVQRLGEIDPSLEVLVVRNDEAGLDEIEAKGPTHLIVSPGPCTPKEAGISNGAIERFAPKIPVLGVCLGHQCIGHTFGAEVVRADRIMHGKTSLIFHDGLGLYRGLSNPFEATRYHSLVIRPGTLPDSLKVVAQTDRDEIMGVRHVTYALEGVQYHPESFLTLEGTKLLKNFVRDLMLRVDQAIEAILERAKPLAARSTPLVDALGLVLAEPILADIDLPPFDKALMDGYAVRSIDLATPYARRFRVVGEITAGRMPTRPLEEGEAAPIMTGAPLPPGADAVVMVERARLEGPDVFLEGPIVPGLNRMTRGREMRVGDPLLEPGAILGAAQLGLIASAGRGSILAIPRPTVSIVPTGDELVSPSQAPSPGQIRNSNGIMLAGLARSWGASDVQERPIAPDDPGHLRSALLGAIEASDVAVLSGGVSAGTKDLVPSTLIDLGVEPVFHKVAVKPGKPIWFGVAASRGSRPGTLVFGLPGNPASGVVGFLLFVRPALDALAGRDPRRTQMASVGLGSDFVHRGDRPTYHPARLVEGQVFPMAWAGSADLRTVALADGFAAFPAGDRVFREGEVISFLPLG